MSAISVVMPVYNGEKYLNQAIDSILDQSFTDFEFIIINDGSTDRTAEILQSYKDPRIILINNQKNLGIIESLNKGFKKASGAFICRMDADDVSLSDRLTVQLNYMKSNPGIAIVGSNAILIDQNGNEISREIYPTTTEEIKKSIFIHNPFAHGSVMIRSFVIKECGLYDKRFIHTEDYDLWLRIAARYDVANLQETLLLRRIHDANITVLKETALIKSRIITLANAIFYYYRKPLLSYHLIRPVLSYLYRLSKRIFKK
ncbi:MAG: glycosyltransferase [Ignavibacteriales bacterium]|nr:glycosyltransferase [Ignavibacteriales bacterium]